MLSCVVFVVDGSRRQAASYRGEGANVLCVVLVVFCFFGIVECRQGDEFQISNGDRQKVLGLCCKAR